MINHSKRGVVGLTWPIFACTTVDLEKFHHGMVWNEINNAINGGSLLFTATMINDTLTLKLYQFDFLWICCNLVRIMCRQQIDQVEYWCLSFTAHISLVTSIALGMQCYIVNFAWGIVTWSIGISMYTCTCSIMSYALLC